MKSSLSSITASSDSHRLPKFLLLLFFFFLLFVSSANCSFSSSSTLPSPAPFSRNNLHHRYCDSFSHETSRSLCSQLQRIHQSFRPFPPQVKGVDPRYGVENRLVPSGPNPLHN